MRQNYTFFLKYYFNLTAKKKAEYYFEVTDKKSPTLKKKKKNCLRFHGLVLFTLLETEIG